MVLLLGTFKTLHNNVNDFSNEWKQKMKCTESSLLLFSVVNESEAKYVTNYSNNELVTKSSAVPDFFG